MKKTWLAIRSAILWFLSILHFFIVAPTLVFLGIFLDARKHDWLQRTFCRRIAFLSGARVEVVRSTGFDPQRTCFFMSNHVNLFDPFILYCAIPQFVRGWELESHFKIPAYGWLMKRFGNVPVPNVRRSSDLKRMWRLTQDAVDGGTSLIIFPEAKRTRDGHVDQFQDGGFRVAQQLGIPIVPVSLVGSFQHHRTGRWMLWPAKITVHLHDTIETNGLVKEDVPALRERVRAIIAAPVEEALGGKMVERVPPGILHEYQSKGVAKFAFRKCMKRNNEDGSGQGRGMYAAGQHGCTASSFSDQVGVCDPEQDRDIRSPWPVCCQIGR